MEKSRNSSLWIEEGYTLFAKEGPAGIQVERLARILQLNKSGFYHYFGDLEGFYEELLNLHRKKVVAYIKGIRAIGTIDPEYLELLVRHKIPVLFHMQLIRITGNSAFQKLVEEVRNEEDLVLGGLWADFLGFHDDPALGMRHFDIVEGMFYTRVKFETFNYPFLSSLVTEAKVLMQQIIEHGEAVADDPVI